VATTTVFVVAVVVSKPLQLLGWWPEEEESTQSWVYDSSKPNNGGKAPVVRLEVEDGGMIGGLCECVDDEAEVTIRSLCENVPAGKTVGVYRAGTEGKKNEDFIGFLHVFRTEAGSERSLGKKER